MTENTDALLAQFETQDAPLPPGITQKEIDRYALLDAALKAYRAEHKALSDKIKVAYPEPGTFIAGAVIIERSESVVTDKDAIVEAYPVEKAPELYTPTLDLKKIPDDVKAEYFTLQQKLSVKRVTS